MTNDEILQAAKEAGFIPDWAIENCHQQFYKFAAIIERKTIERCAVVCNSKLIPHITFAEHMAIKMCAAAIRKLGEQ